MKTTIYYFSGTGNSLKVAQDLTKKLGNTELIPITKVIKEYGEILFSSDRIGIVYPVYIWGMPPIVSKFIKKISKTNKVKYFFAVATNHMQVVGSLLILANRLHSRGLKLSAGFSIIMPNSYTLSQKEHSIDNLKPLFAASEKRLDEISLLIENEDECKIERGPLKQRIINTGFIYHSVSLIFPWLDMRFSTDNNCISCGLCEKICPVQNIVLKNGNPVWLHKCEQCFRCINLCPKQSIQYKNKTTGKWRYKNPSIKLDDLINK
ncbi:EFR1 family ferrodoxin [Clostridium estertheticum]|uniref:EFR1 family ferrodoxin n=1 Tax=Clostridium estertheticum TaxID=238834 RepID=UPI001C6DF2AF|nr:EFR1 family ferrodoxin [Clostridium estertheticum]MBW9152909.1 EFR1 family ferrodoxin [Clostridium estertheticum]WLC82719.1 EFR1 family ferrodoxin [Clostridium estertheticum]